MCPPYILQNAPTIRKCDPDCQRIPIAHFWPDCLEDEEYPGIRDYFDLLAPVVEAPVITRPGIFNLAQTARNTREQSDIMKVFLATVVWGYGRRPYGPYRLNRMLETPNVDQRIANAFNHMLDEDRDLEERLGSAYNTLSGINGLGLSFISKFFYFAGFEALAPKPVILDKRVFDCWRRHIDIPISRNFHGLMRYIEIVNQCAQELDVRPDQIEYFLWCCQGE